MESQKLYTNIRWLIRRDFPSILEIENSSFQFPWTEEDFANSLRQRNNIGFVAEHHEIVVGYMIYSLLPNKFVLVSMAVHPKYRRCDVGTQLIKKLISKLDEKRTFLELEVRETNLQAQLFFKKCGLKATKVIKNSIQLPCGEKFEDAFVMQYRKIKSRY